MKLRDFILDCIGDLGEVRALDLVEESEKAGYWFAWGRVYPTLRSMTRAGLLARREVQRSAHAGPADRPTALYSLSNAGIDAWHALQ